MLKIFVPRICLIILLRSGIGYASDSVTSLSRLYSTQRRNVPSFFIANTTGAAHGEVLGSTSPWVSISRTMLSIAVCFCCGHGYGLSTIGDGSLSKFSCSINLVQPTLSLNTTAYLFNILVSFARVSVSLPNSNCDKSGLAAGGCDFPFQHVVVRICLPICIVYAAESQETSLLTRKSCSSNASQYKLSRIVASNCISSAPILASNEVVPLFVAVRTVFVGPRGVLPYLRATVGFTYYFCACESNRAVTKPDGNSSSTARVGILSGRVRVPLFVVLPLVEWGN